MATAEQYAAWIVQNQDKIGSPEFETVARAYQTVRADPNAKYKAMQTTPTVDPTADMSAGQKFSAGAGKAFYDIGQGAAQLVGAGESAEELRNRRQIDAPLMSTAAGVGGNLLANITAMAPLAAVPGANTIAGAGAVGSTLAALQPAEGARDRAGNMAIGFGLGSAVQSIPHIPQVVSRAKEIGRALIDPFSEAGKKQIIGKTLNEFSGGQSADVIRNLEEARQFVQGSQPTAAQVANNSGIAGLERTAVATQPAVNVLHGQQLARQNEARISALSEIAGTGGKREFFDASRREAAENLYREAYDKGIDIKRDPATGRMLPKNVVSGVRGEITKLLQRPSIQEAVNQARRLAADEGVKITNPAGSIQGLDYVKRALDDKIGSTTGNEQRILSELKSRLVTTLDRLSPKYAEARATFQEMSKPINQMDVADMLLDKSVNKLTGILQPQAYARSLTDDLAARATGFNRATLQNIMEPNQLAILNAIKEDLARSQFALNAGRGPGSDTVQKMAMANILNSTGAQNIPTLLSRPAMLTNWLLQKSYAGADREMSKMLAEALLNPQQTAALMRGVVPPATPLPAQTVQRLGILGRSAGLPMIPYAVGD